MLELSWIIGHPAGVWELLGGVEGKRGWTPAYQPSWPEFLPLLETKPVSDWGISLLSAPLYNKSPPHSCLYSVFHHLPLTPFSPLPNSKVSYRYHSTGPLVNVTNDLKPHEIPRSISVPILLDLTAALLSLYERRPSLGQQNATLSEVLFLLLRSWLLFLCLPPNSECERAQGQFSAPTPADIYL